jgi:hypothetical protein
VFFGQVIAGSASADANPLLYHRGSYIGLEAPEREEAFLAAAKTK